MNLRSSEPLGDWSITGSSPAAKPCSRVFPDVEADWMDLGDALRSGAECAAEIRFLRDCLRFPSAARKRYFVVKSVLAEARKQIKRVVNLGY